MRRIAEFGHVMTITVIHPHIHAVIKMLPINTQIKVVERKSGVVYSHEGVITGVEGDKYLVNDGREFIDTIVPASNIRVKVTDSHGYWYGQVHGFDECGSIGTCTVYEDGEEILGKLVGLNPSARNAAGEELNWFLEIA